MIMDWITEYLKEIDLEAVCRLFPGIDAWKIHHPLGGIDRLLGIGEAYIYPVRFMTVWAH